MEFISVARHAGARGNEYADKFAGMAAVEIRQAKDRADNRNAIREARRGKEWITDCESKTLHKRKNAKRKVVWPKKKNTLRQSRETTKNNTELESLHAGG